MGDGDGALARARELSPDVLVLDEQMDGAWGSAVAQTLAREGSATRFVIYRAEADLRGWARGLEAVRFVSKAEPFGALIAAICAEGP